MPDVCKTYQFCLCYVSVKNSLGAWCHRIASLVWLNSTCNCWTVSCISLHSAGSLLLCQEYRWTVRKCQRYSPKWLSTLSMIWLTSFAITDFLKLLSGKYQSLCHRRLPNLNVPYFERHWIHVQLRHICQPQTWSHEDSQAWYLNDSNFPFGLVHLDFSQVLRHEETVCPVYLPLFHSQYARHDHLLEKWF